MLGPFQQSQLRIEIAASASDFSRALLHTRQLRCWLLPQLILDELPPELVPGITFTSWVGPIPVEHTVEFVEAEVICFSLSRAVDGVHYWSWGEGWVQSRLEGISGFPLHLGNIATLLRLKTYLGLQERVRSPQS